MDDGSTGIFIGFRSLHFSERGPGKGGVRYAPDVDATDVRPLAMLMTWKCALTSLPLGDAECGVACDPKQLSALERERFAGRYAGAFGPLVGPDIDIPAPDLSAGPDEMA
jgi:glutamate dehydrogenase (NAD(P)+)